MELLLEDYQDTLDGIEVRRVGRVFIDLNVLLLNPFSKRCCSMHWDNILLNTASPMVSLMSFMTGRTRDSSNLRYTLHSPISQQRDRKPHNFPPRPAPDHHRNSFAQGLTSVVASLATSPHFSWRYQSIVAIDTSGAYSSRSCSRVGFR